jgi:UDP-glucose 4-epimerase
MKILITGALGHIGSYIIRELPKHIEGLELVLIDNMRVQRYCSLFNLPTTAKYRFIEGDVRKLNLENEIVGADAVIHLAAITDAAGSFGNKEEVEENNFEASRVVANACVSCGVPMIHLSSTSVYGTQAEVVDENCTEEELMPQSPYAETKLKEERYLRELGENGKLRYVTFRFGTISGVSPGMRFHTAVNKFCWQAVMGQPITVWRTALHQKRPYLALPDALDAMVFVIKNNLFDNTIYNILSDNLTVNDIVEAIRAKVPSLKIEYVDSVIMNQLSYEVSRDKFTRKGFTFRASLKDSITETIDLLYQAGGR